jgi:hypothetical protein
MASDVGVSHIEMSPVRRGTPEAALKAIRPELAGAMSESQTVDVAETVIGGPPTGSSHDGNATDGTDGTTTDGARGAGEDASAADERTPPA